MEYPNPSSNSLPTQVSRVRLNLRTEHYHDALYSLLQLRYIPCLLWKPRVTDKGLKV